MPLRFNKKLLLAKEESVAGTAEVLAAADAILAGNIEITPLAGDTVTREVEKLHFGRDQDIHVNAHQTISFRVELAGSGDNDTAPAWGKLLLGCGFAQIITTNTNVAYTPVSAGEKTLTIGLNIDGQLFTLSGARGTFQIEAGANQIPYLNFTFTGKYTAPSSAAAVAGANFNAFQTPLAGSNANTPTFNLFGFANLALSTYSYEHGNEVVHRELIGANPEVIITNRAPSFSVTMDAPRFAAQNFVDLAKTSHSGSLRIIHGVGAGKVVQIDALKVQAAAPTISEADGAMQMQLTLNALPSAAAGNDEITIITS